MNPNSKPPWSLKTKLTLFMSAIFLFSIWTLAFYAKLVLHKELEELAGEQQFSAVSVMAAQINEALAVRLNALEGMAPEIKPVLGIDTASSQEFLEMHPFLQKLFNGGVFIIGSDGTAIADVPLSAGRIGVNYLDRTTVSSPLKEGKSMIGRPAMGKKLGAPIFSISAPIRNVQGTVAGVIVGTINLNLPSFLDEVTANHYGKTGGYLLVAPQHRLVVTATDKRRIMTPTPAPGTIPSIDRFMEGHEGSSVYWNPLGEQVLASAKGIPVAGWYLVASLPTAEAFAPLHKMQHHIFLAAILLTILAGGLTLWTLRRMLAPMLTAAATLATMAASNQQLQPLPIVRQDEIGQLIGGFNGMLKVLAEQREALRKSEARYRSILNASPVPMAINDEQQNITYLNPAFVQTFGYTLGDLPTLTDWYSQAHPDPRYRQEVAEAWQKSLKTATENGDTFSPLEVTVRCKDLANKIVLVAAASLSDTFKEDHLVVLYDITARKRSEAALVESEEKFRAIFNNSEDGVLFTAPDGRIFSANKAACEMLGWSEQELCHGGRHLVLDTADPRLPRALDERRRTGRFQGELNYKRRDGTLFPVELSSTIFPFGNSEVRSCIIFRDITDRVQVEKELHNALAEREVLLREVHHRVKNNMAAIIGLLNLQQSAVGDPQSKTIMADLSARIHAMSLVHEKFFRSDSLSKVDFQEYLQSLISHLRTSFGSPRIFCDIAARGVEMPLDLAIPCGMIINELIINALKYAFPKEWSGRDEARIQVAMTHDNNTFTLSVADNGVGLPPGFDLNMTNTLGLSLVQMLGQHQLGGRFEVDRTGGTRIALTFSPHIRKKTNA